MSTVHWPRLLSISIGAMFIAGLLGLGIGILFNNATGVALGVVVGAVIGWGSIYFSRDYWLD